MPFIDFLLCIIAFLLVTAVWTEMARLEADALVPKISDDPTPVASSRTFHVEPHGKDRFRLTWKDGSTVVATEDVASRAAVDPAGDVSFPDLVKAVARSAREHGAHRAPTDLARDRAVLHTKNDAAFEQIAAWLDAIHGARRVVSYGGATSEISAFNVAFSID